MQAPKLRGDRIEGGLEHQGSYPMDRNTDASAWFLYPYNREDIRPGVAQTIHIALLTFVGAVFNGLFFLLTLDNALKAFASPTTAADIVIRSIQVGLVAATLYLIVKMWTYKSEFRHYVYPEIALASIVTKEIGILPALGSAGMLMFGYAMTGLMVRHLITAPEAGLVNGAGVALTASAKGLLWAATTFIVFNYVYNIKFFNDDGKMESSYSATRRAVKTTAMAIFVATVGLGNVGLISYSSGLYVAGVVANGIHYDWPFHVFVPLLASSAGAALLYLIFAGFSWFEGGGRPSWNKMKRTEAGIGSYESESTTTNSTPLLSTSSAVRSRKPVQVTF